MFSSERCVNMLPLVPRRALTLAAGIAVATTLCGKAQASLLTRNEASLVRAMNEVRGATGLRPLRLDPRLELAARRHSRKMLRVQTLFHGNFALRIRRVGVKAPAVGENLAWGTGPLARARKIVSLWLASPEHRANLLRRGYRTVGVGVKRGRFEGYAGAALITADFAGR
jgi:uncharacterized protein YkwD